LITLEIEAPTLEQAITLPVFGKEVTYDNKYNNINLAR
jgi:CYTH domain-containing protein